MTVHRLIWAPGASVATLDGMIESVGGRARRTARRAVLALGVLLAVVALAAAVLWPASPPSAGAAADRILASSRITLADGARTDIEDTAAGVPARSGIRLSAAMLDGMLDQAATYTFHVSDVAGAAFDVDLIGGRRLDPAGAVERQFIDGCRANGASVALHRANRVHCAW